MEAAARQARADGAGRGGCRGHDPFPSPPRTSSLDAAGWNDLLEEARGGIVRFAGGELRISPTPAMTLIDVDGHLPPDELAVVGASAAARAIRRLDIGGSIGVDLPDRRRQGGAASRGRRNRRHAASAVRAHRGQWLRLRPDRPPAPPRFAGRAGPGPRGVRSPGAASPRRVRNARSQSGWSPIPR